MQEKNSGYAYDPCAMCRRPPCMLWVKWWHWGLSIREESLHYVHDSCSNTTAHTLHTSTSHHTLHTFTSHHTPSIGGEGRVLWRPLVAVWGKCAGGVCCVRSYIYNIAGIYYTMMTPGAPFAAIITLWLRIQHLGQDTTQSTLIITDQP